MICGILICVRFSVIQKNYDMILITHVAFNYLRQRVRQGARSQDRGHMHHQIIRSDQKTKNAISQEQIFEDSKITLCE